MTPEQQELFDQLTALQQRTATGVLAGMSQRAAYYAAGGTAKSDTSADATVCVMLRDAKVKSFMDSMKLQAVSDAIMSRQEMLERLSLFGRFGPSDLAEFRTVEAGRDMDSGEPIMQSVWHFPDSVLQDRQKLSIISELSAGKEGIKFKTHSPIQAMQLLAKMQGYEAPQKSEIKITRSAADLTDDELAALLSVEQQKESGSDNQG